jgi:hypothetical protein
MRRAAEALAREADLGDVDVDAVLGLWALERHLAHPSARTAELLQETVDTDHG